MSSAKHPGIASEEFSIPPRGGKKTAAAQAPLRRSQGVQSVEVAGRLLHALVDHGDAMMLRDLAKAAQMPPAKAHRYLVSLLRMGLAVQDAQTGLYDLGPFSLELGLASQDRMDAIGIASLAIRELRNLTLENVVLAVWGERGPTVVRVLDSRRFTTLRARTGSVLPVTQSATGLVFTAFLPKELTAGLVAAELDQNRRSSNAGAPKTRKELEERLAEVREHEMARVKGTVTRDLNALSAPVFDHTGTVVLAITIIAYDTDFNADWKGREARALKDAAQSVSNRLGFSVDKARARQL